MRRVFATPSPDAPRPEALLEREKLLKEQLRHLDRASYRQRTQIDAELAAIHRLLVTLGLRSEDAG